MMTWLCSVSGPASTSERVPSLMPSCTATVRGLPGRSGLSIGREVLGCGLGRHRADYSPREEDPSMLDLGLNGKVAIITG